MDEWGWLANVDPNTIERERYNTDARKLRRREGTHLEFITPTEPRPVRARRELIDRRANVWGQLRGVQNQLRRERREHARAIAWEQKLRARGDAA